MTGAVAGAGLELGPGPREVDGVAWASAGDPGSPAVPVLLLHGVTDSGECWAPVARHLAGSRLVVTVDARGHGRTPLGDEPFTIAALARDAAAVVGAVVGRPVVVVGHSMGGIVAEELALTAPALVAGLVLEEPAWDGAADRTADGVPAFLPGFLASFAGVPEDALVAWSRRANPTWADDEHGPWARSKTQLDQRLVQVPHEWAARDWVAALADVAAPVALVTGVTERGSVVDAAARARAHAVLGDRLTDVVLPTAGHNARRDDRAGFLAALDAALARVERVSPGGP